MKFYILIFTCLSLFACSVKNEVTLISDSESPRIRFGVEKLSEALSEAGYEVHELKGGSSDASKMTIFISSDSLNSQKEGFKITSTNNRIEIHGNDASGALYGMLKVVNKIKDEGKLTSDINLSEQPEMVMRGTCIGLQKTTYLPGRGVYEYPYTPENFPWFYDKELWVDYLDMMVDNRFNSLYLWNGHPFASLVKLKDYPFAVEVDDETFKKNEDIYNFITKEADKRGIWVIQMFYNIIVSKPFADHYDMLTQDRQRPITPLVEDYTKQSITAFIEKYPNVGLLVALGEAMSGRENDVKWFTETIIPGVKEGLKALGRTDEPPIILRAHDTDAPFVMDKALPLYKNLYTVNKYNGESLTTYEPQGPWTETHQKLSSLGSVHIANVHILANLEPFRYGSPDFIQKSVQAMRNIHGANGLHLYPQTSYWDWPYTADIAEPRLLEMDRDWIWYEAWARYAWKSDRTKSDELNYWSQTIGSKFGLDADQGALILKAYEETGEIAPKALRKFGITEGNRQTLLLGMFMSQLVNPNKYHVYPGFYESTGPDGEILAVYAEKEWNNQTHIGETPPQLISEITTHAQKAVEAIDKVSGVEKNKAEFERLKNDIHSYKAFADCFADKVNAALWILRYQNSKDLEDLKKAVPYVESNLEHYRTLVDLTKNTYAYANSMQTAQRRIPIGGNDGNFKTWTELLPQYERELENFKRNLERLENKGSSSESLKDVPAWQATTVNFVGDALESYTLKQDVYIFKGDTIQIEKLAPELQNLKAFHYPQNKQIEEGTHIKFETDQPVKLVVGYFSTDQKRFLLPPTLETNAAGNTMGQADIVLANAIKFKEYPRVNIHTYSFEKGVNELHLDKGRVLLLGFIKAETPVTARDVGLIDEGELESMDWLFY